jgi:hypothetical protein
LKTGKAVRRSEVSKGNKKRLAVAATNWVKIQPEVNRIQPEVGTLDGAERINNEGFVVCFVFGRCSLRYL